MLLLRHHGALGAGSGGLGFHHVQRGLRLVQPHLGGGASGAQRAGTVVVQLGLMALRRQRGQAGVQRGDLHGQLGINHLGQHLAGLHRIAFAHGQAAQRAGDAGAGLDLADALHRGEDRLAILHLGGGDAERRLGQRRGRQQRQRQRQRAGCTPPE